MQSEENEPNVIIEQDNFILKVKLLSNEVYQINTRSNIAIPDLKKLIQAKTNVPVDKQRLVFGGKQLVDTAKLSDYVKESGLTIHLIAKLQQPTQPTQSVQQQTNAQQPQQPSNNPTQPSRTQPQNQPTGQTGAQIPPQQPPIPPLIPGFPNIGNIFSSIMGGNQQPNQANNEINNLFSGLGSLGGVQIRFVSSPVVGVQQPNIQSQQNQPNQQQPTSNVVPPIPQNIPQQNNNPSVQQQPNPQQQNLPSNQVNQRSYPPPQMGALNHLHNLINRITIPQQPHVPQNLNQREQTAFYLRRLHNQLLRFIPQLNRGIQLLNEGRVAHLQDFLPAFHMINRSNAEAIDIIQRLLGSQNQQNQNAHQHSPQHSHQHPHSHQHSHHGHSHSHSHPHSQQNQQNRAPNQQPAQRQANEGTQVNQNANRTQNSSQPQQSSNPFDLLSGLYSPNSGFNFANIFGQRPQQNTNQQQQNTQQIQQNQPSQVPQQPATNPVRTQAQQPTQSTMVDQQNERSNQPVENSQPPSNSRDLPQVQTLNAASLSQQLNSVTIQVQGQNGQPAQGVNVMSLFNDMQQNGGIGQLLNMSLGDMAQEGQIDPIYKHIFQVVSGGQIIAIFTTKNFSFLNTKKVQLRQAVLKAISSAGSREELVTRYAEDLSTIFIPSVEIKNKELCIKRVLKILRKHIEKVIAIILDSPAELNIETPILVELKLLFCETVQELYKFCENTQLVFNHIKTNSIAKIDRLAQGMAPLFYSIVQRDLVRIYREYSEEEQRKRQRSEQEAKDEAQLISQIEEQAHKDVEYLASYEHSKYYPGKK